MDPGAFHSDLHLCTGDSDWFRVVLAEAADLRVFVHFFHFEGDLTVFLYDADMTNLNDVISATPPVEIEGMSTSNDECIIERGAPAGTYFVEVVGADADMEARYDIELALIAAADGCPDVWPH